MLNASILQRNRDPSLRSGSQIKYFSDRNRVLRCAQDDNSILRLFERGQGPQPGAAMPHPQNHGTSLFLFIQKIYFCLSMKTMYEEDHNSVGTLPWACAVIT